MKQIVKIETTGRDLESLKSIISKYNDIQIMKVIGNWMILASSKGFSEFEKETGISTYAPF